MKTNDLKKGDRVLLNNGWYATIADNKKGNTRLAEVEGFCKETGSVYSHDIGFYIPSASHRQIGPRVQLEHTEKQLQLKTQLAEMGL
tara:strand:- start:24 stop:284 length:261 start_codon:yes stop_codon:yes gene_type:complete